MVWIQGDCRRPVVRIFSNHALSGFRRRADEGLLFRRMVVTPGRFFRRELADALEAPPLWGVNDEQGGSPLAHRPVRCGLVPHDIRHALADRVDRSILMPRNELSPHAQDHVSLVAPVICDVACRVLDHPDTKAFAHVAPRPGVAGFSRMLFRRDPFPIDRGEGDAIETHAISDRGQGITLARTDAVQGGPSRNAKGHRMNPTSRDQRNASRRDAVPKRSDPVGPDLGADSLEQV